MKSELSEKIKTLSIYQLAELLGEDYLEESLVGCIEGGSIEKDLVMARIGNDSMLGELKAATQELVDLFKESHDEEIQNSHFGDDSLCSYCTAIARAEAALKGV